MENKMTIEEICKQTGDHLIRKGLSLSVAESCTGGLIGSAITEIAGSSTYFRGGIIAYDNCIKEKLLGVPHQVLLDFGAVSTQTVEAMATGACKLLETDCAISVSGIAGPGGGTSVKPVGRVYIGIAIEDILRSYELDLIGTRKDIRIQAVNNALSLFLQLLM
jgi:PncC family amidohydrolase